MNLRKLMGIHKLEAPCTAVVKNPTPYGGLFRLGSPITIDKNEYEKSKRMVLGSHLKVTTHFPQTITNRRNFDIAILSINDIEIISLSPINEVTQYISVEHFTPEIFSEARCNL